MIKKRHGLEWYKKYRPKNLDDIVGQKKTVLNLKNRFMDRTIPQTTILIGESGLGKDTLARIIAMHIVCDNIDERGNPCCECKYCRDIIEENFNLSVRNENCSNLNVEKLRELEEDSNVLDWSGKPKVYILSEYQEIAHKASKNFLIQLENDNQNAYFIITSMEKFKIPEAVRDRGQTYYLKPVESNDLGMYLIDILDKERVDYPKSFVTDGGLSILSENCVGSVRRAISYLEQIVYSELWTEKEIIKELELVSQESVIKIVKGIIKNETEVVFTEKWTDDLFKTVRSSFIEILKIKKGLKTYRIDSFMGISQSVSEEQLQHILSVFFEMNKFYYWNEELITFFVLQAMSYTAINVIKPNTEPPVQRRIKRD